MLPVKQEQQKWLTAYLRAWREIARPEPGKTMERQVHKWNTTAKRAKQHPPAGAKQDKSGGAKHQENGNLPHGKPAQHTPDIQQWHTEHHPQQESCHDQPDDHSQQAPRKEAP